MYKLKSPKSLSIQIKYLVSIICFSFYLCGCAEVLFEGLEASEVAEITSANSSLSEMGLTLRTINGVEELTISNEISFYRNLNRIQVLRQSNANPLLFFKNESTPLGEILIQEQKLKLFPSGKSFSLNENIFSVEKDFVYVRAGRLKSANIIGQVYKKDVVVVLSEKTGWYEIRFLSNGIPSYGYIPIDALMPLALSNSKKQKAEHIYIPTIYQIKSDLIGRSTQSWIYNDINQIKEIKIISTKFSTDYLYYILELELENNNTQKQFYSTIEVSYLWCTCLNNIHCWKFNNIREQSLAVDTFSYAFGANVATNLRSQGIDQINFFSMENAMNDVFNKNALSLTDAQNKMAIQQKLVISMSKKLEIIKEEGKQFLAINKKNPGVVELPNGLQYEIIKQGTGEKPQATDIIKANYRGTLISGQEFDNSYTRGQPLQIAVDGVISGWTQALEMMPVGSKWKLYIPSSLGYGDNGAGSVIPGGAVLIFEIELLEIIKK